jgi:ERCC4-type nuclease
MYIVMYDDEMDIRALYSWDPEVEGGLALLNVGGGVALFRTREAAQTAINISKAAEKLRRLQGEPHNEDWRESLHNVRITPATTEP